MMKQGNIDTITIITGNIYKKRGSRKPDRVGAIKKSSFKMKRKSWAIAALAILALVACNNAGDKTTPSTTDSSSAMPATAAVEPAVPKLAAPFDIVEINHAVKDYDKWRPAFNSDSTARKASGLEDIVVGRSVDNPNSLLVTLKVSDMEKAKAFAADPRLKDVMEKNGVISKSDINYFHVIRVNPDSKENQWVQITHKVKDFDAWVKVFDAEGTATRASFGLVT